MMKNRNQEAIEREEEKNQPRKDRPEDMSEGLQEAIRKTQKAIHGAFSGSNKKRPVRIKVTLSA